MDNSVTNRLRLIEVFPVEGLPLLGNIKMRWFDRVVSPIEGICQEVYRGKSYIDSVYPQRYQTEATNRLPVKARKGDLIYRVTLTPQPHDFTGVVRTKDDYRRIYHVHVQLRVNNPNKCVECYRNSKDPASLVIDEFRTGFERFFSRYTHDSLSNVNPGFDAFNKKISSTCGIIIENPNWSFYADRQHEKELEIQRDIELKKREILAEVEIKSFELQNRTELKKKEIASDAEVKEWEDDINMRRERAQRQFDRDEKVRQNDFLREEKIKSRLNEARIKLLSMTLDDLTAINSERIRDAFDTNASVRKVLPKFCPN